MIVTNDWVKKVITARSDLAHKGDFGRVLLIGGQLPYGGAIIMAAKACVASGAGLVTVATAKETLTALYTSIPEAMAGELTNTLFLKEQLAKAEVILLGPGLSENAHARAVFDLVLERIQPHQVLILDGSALGILSDQKERVEEIKQLILTPHQKEWERLSGIAIASQSDERNQEALATFPKGTILVHKRHGTKIYQNHQVAELTVGGPYQATGGMGDTLAGMIAGFVGQFKKNSFDSVVAATYLHSYTADLLAKDHYVVLPTQISDHLPQVMRALQPLVKLSHF